MCCVEERLLKLEEVLEMCGLSRSAFYRLEAEGKFVPKVMVGENSPRYRFTNVTAWIAARDRTPPGVWQHRCCD